MGLNDGPGEVSPPLALPGIDEIKKPSGEDLQKVGLSLDGLNRQQSQTLRFITQSEAQLRRQKN